MTLALFLAMAWSVSAAGIREDFSTNPALRGWQVSGEATLFQWNAAGQNLQVTWDSSRPNSFFYRPLNTVLSKSDDFILSFEIQLEEVAVGLRGGHPFTFELAVGLLHFRDATDPQFTRGTGTRSPNLVEFDYFPDSGFGATISPTIVSTNNQFIPSFSFPLELTPGDRFGVTMQYRNTNQTLTTTMTRNGAPFGPIKDVTLPASFTDFRVDTLAVSSYSDTGADGSILARGVVDDIIFETPTAPIVEFDGALVNGVWQAQFVGRTNWTYALERSEDLREWRALSPAAAGTGERQLLSDDAPTATKSLNAFYRLRADRP